MADVVVTRRQPGPDGKVEVTTVEFPPGTDPFKLLEHLFAGIKRHEPDLKDVPEPPTAGVQPTSRQAYARARAEGKLTARQQQVKEYLEHNIQATRQEIAAGTGMGINVVCGRVNEMLHLGVLVELDARKCRVTGQNAKPLLLL